MGYTPKSDVLGDLVGYTKDRDIIIENNVGRGLLKSNRLAEVKENILEMMIDIIGERGELLVDCDEKTCWKISFCSCWKVLYETDAKMKYRRKYVNVRDMKKSQLAYYGQSISVCESATENFYKVDLDLSIMEMHVECKDILVEKVLKENVNFFGLVIKIY